MLEIPRDQRDAYYVRCSSRRRQKPSTSRLRKRHFVADFGITKRTQAGLFCAREGPPRSNSLARSSKFSRSIPASRGAFLRIGVETIRCTTRDDLFSVQRSPDRCGRRCHTSDAPRFRQSGELHYRRRRRKKRVSSRFPFAGASRTSYAWLGEIHS